MPMTAFCPLCEAPNEIADANIGRFVVCDRCREPFYAVVPPLEKTSKKPQSLQSQAVPLAKKFATTASPTADTLLDLARSQRKMLTVVLAMQMVLMFLIAALFFVRT